MYSTRAQQRSWSASTDRHRDVMRAIVSVRTEDELEDALEVARDREALVLIEVVMSRLDAPGPLVRERTIAGPQ